jgi:hypothetical protein
VPDETTEPDDEVTGGLEGASAPDEDGPQTGPGSVPLDVDGVRTMIVGTLAWAIAAIVLLALRSRLVDEDREWWLWVCVAGFGLGLFGYRYCRRRRDRLRAGSPAPTDRT